MKINKNRKPKAGLLLIASPRFRDLGEGLQRGTYAERKGFVVDAFLEQLQDELEIVFPDVVYEREDVEKAMTSFFVERVDFVIAEYLSWAEDFAWIRFLRDMPSIPMLFVNHAREKVSFEDTLDEDDFIDFLCAGNLVGSLEAGGSIARMERPDVKIVMGSDFQIYQQIVLYARAARVRGLLKQSTFGLLANYNEVMWSTYMDPYNLFTRIGPELRFIPYSAYAEEIEAVPSEETAVFKERLMTKYKMMDDVVDDKFDASIQASLGIARLVESYSIDAMIFNDIDPAMFRLIGLRAGFYPDSLNERTSILVPEADLGAGMITYILKLLSGKQVNFIEPFHIEYGENTFAAGHAGPNDYNEAGPEDVLIARDVRFAKTNYKYAGAPFAWYRISPGRKTMAQFVEDNGRYKLVCTQVDSLPGKHLFASYSHSIFRPVDMQVTDLFEHILKVGTTQHFAIVDGDYRKELQILSEMMHFDYYEFR
ncbi:hypothetical protein H8784_00840 [Parabacteroides acidifaciens]|uniref:Fucose isomerase n=2 Tax=Parabacteroides acidifaciens TaxID=2290935 RepID=A0A3D8HJ01_9BACT|nr:hypothetical protein [Parabacteroides acidifaciens]RDU50901.1 hypothetical protein DWU89_00860 [Parabacteroides acidifaciens]